MQPGGETKMSQQLSVQTEKKNLGKQSSLKMNSGVKKFLTGLFLFFVGVNLVVIVAAYIFNLLGK